MIKELSDALKSLIESIYTKPLATILAVILICMTYFVYLSHGKIETMIITPEEEAQKFKQQLETVDLVNSALEKLREDLNADNVLIKQFHNGRHDLTGLPFTEASTTFYSDPKDVHKSAPAVEEPIASLDKSLRYVWKTIDKPECVILYEPVDISTRRYFKAHKLDRVAICPLVNLLNYPIGIVTIGFSEGNTMSDEEIKNKTSSMAKRITGYLNGN